MSRKDKKEWTLETLLSVVGFVFELLRVVVNALRARNGTVDDLRRLIREPKLVDEVFDLIINAKTVAAGTFHAFVDYVTPSHKELESAFDWAHSYYEQTNFREIGICRYVWRKPHVVGFDYLHMGCVVVTDNVLEEMERRNLRPALYEELLAFAKAYPDEQRKFPIVALGSVHRGGDSHFVAFLSADSDGRNLDLRSANEGFWHERYRFLAVPK